MAEIITGGLKQVREEFVQAHCQRLHQWYDGQGQFIYAGNQPDSRERLWACTSLLQQRGLAGRKLAEAIIVATPIDDNAFEPVAALDLLLAYPEQLSEASRAHLLAMCREHVVAVLEHLFSCGGAHNFSCMYSYFLACASQVLDGYEFTVPHHRIPAVYSRQRLAEIGVNAALLLRVHAEGSPIFAEWNSPTYSPVSAMALAKTVRDCANPTIRQWALEAELWLWREVLALYHPRLNVPCGPYGRAYRVDVLGQVSLMRALLCLVGISGDRSIVELLDESQPGVQFHHSRDLPFNWANIAWLVSCDYQLPADAVQELNQRVYPKRFEAPFAWESFGAIDAKSGQFVPVQGDVLPAGSGRMVQKQQENWALGYRTASNFGQSFPIHLHYAIGQGGTMQSVRNVMVGVGLISKPQEWVPGCRGGQVEADNFNHGFELNAQQEGQGVSFQGSAMRYLAMLPMEEASLNSFVPLHFAPVDQVTLNGQVWQAGQTIELKTRKAICRISDHGCQYEIVYEFDEEVTVALFRWANFLRLAAFYYRGPAQSLAPQCLDGFTVRGQLRLLNMPG
jgi:hypothetical protein